MEALDGGTGTIKPDLGAIVQDVVLFSKPVFGDPNVRRKTVLNLSLNTPSISRAQGIAVIESTVDVKSTWLKSSSNELQLACGTM